VDYCAVLSPIISVVCREIDRILQRMDAVNITDVPQSGIYYQQGAIAQIVVQLIDNQTGLPIQIQTATGMSITLLYPDRVTTQSFSASLYTDGSDGMIAYTTRNNGTIIDLSQVGLYQMQGNAAIGGIQLPPSYATDLYVLGNASGNPAPPPIFNSTTLIMFDPSGIRWGITVDPSGVIQRTLTPTGPANYIMFNTLVLTDSNGVYWTITISTAGVIIATAGGSFAHALPSIILMDTNGRSWVITVSTSGVVSAA